MEEGDKHLEIPVRSVPEGQTLSFIMKWLSAWSWLPGVHQGRKSDCVSRCSSICPILRVSRNLDFKDTASEVLEGVKNMLLGTAGGESVWGSDGKILKLPPIVMWKAELGCRAGEISKPHMQVPPGFFLLLLKKWREINGGKLFNKKEPGLDESENSQSLQMEKVAKIKIVCTKKKMWQCHYIIFDQNIRKIEVRAKSEDSEEEDNEVGNSKQRER